jgi:hypothetical protein
VHDPHQLRPVEHRHFPVEDDHVGGFLADLFQHGDTVAGFDDALDADIVEQTAHDGAHKRIVVDHKHVQLLEQDFGLLGVDRYGAGFQPGNIRREVSPGR